MFFLPALLPFLGPFLIALTGSLVARVLFSLGMGFVTYTVLSEIVESLISYSNVALSGLSPVVLAFMQLSGFVSSLSIVGSALATRAALLGIKRLAFL